jgi:hypothetical protein
MRKIHLFTLLVFSVQTINIKAQLSLNWCTYYGETSAYLEEERVSPDGFGNILFCGSTTSNANIALNGYQTTFGGSRDACVVKFDPSGNRIWGTYIGGAQSENGLNETAVDSLGNIYVAGTTSSINNISFNGFQNNLSGGSDMYLIKLDKNGNRLWATYYGGPLGEMGGDVTVDEDGNIYLCGATGSTSGIAFGGFQTAFGGGSSDCFVVKFDSNGNRLWSTYIGGNDTEIAFYSKIKSDLSGNIYVSGVTSSFSGISFNGFQNNHGGGIFPSFHDAFLVKLDKNGNRLWATYYGGGW